jgi:transposase-like protein
MARSLRRRWPETARAAALHAISLASAALTTAWARTAESRLASRRREGEATRLRAEIALLIGELELKDARWTRHPARRRPHYGPYERMRILELRAARGWSASQAAERFLVTEETIDSWMRTLEAGGEAGMVRMREPVNKFPEFVAYLVRMLKRLCPTLGKARIRR